MALREVRFALVLALVFAVACGPAAPGRGEVEADVFVTIRDGEMEMETTELEAGEIRIGIINEGSMPHELKIWVGDQPVDGLPTTGAEIRSQVIEIRGLLPGGRSPVVAPGRSLVLTITLAAGRYVFFCNRAGHYAAGERIEVHVR